jgi:hypothetical protein
VAGVTCAAPRLRTGMKFSDGDKVPPPSRAMIVADLLSVQKLVSSVPGGDAASGFQTIGTIVIQYELCADRLHLPRSGLTPKLRVAQRTLGIDTNTTRYL